VVKCIEAGLPLLLENLSESIDAVLDPVIGKLVTKRGRATVLKLGDAEVEYNPNFRCAVLLNLCRAPMQPARGRMHR
jgi:dynein heavy chain